MEYKNAQFYLSAAIQMLANRNVEDVSEKSVTFKAWFPEGENDPEITLLKVDAHHAQYWDTPSAVAHVISLAKGLVTGQREANPGSTGKVELGNH